MSIPPRSPAQERWLQFFNRVVYQSLPAAYNAMDRFTLGAWWHLVRRALDYVPAGGRVLEVGFGPGRLQVELARKTDESHGLDLAMGMCRYTQRRLKANGLDSRILRGSAFALPYAGKVFDSVVSTFAFSGFPAGARALAEMYRVTAPGGRLVLIDIGLPTNGNRLGIYLARLWERMGDFLYDQPALMQAAGLGKIEYEEYGPGQHIRAVVGRKPEI